MNTLRDEFEGPVLAYGPHFALFNRQTPESDFKLPDDGWYHVVPTGEHLHHDTGIMQILDNKAVDSIIQSFQNDSKNPNFAGLQVDFDHSSYNGSSSEAAAWIDQLQKRDTGVWAHMRWTDVGIKAVTNGRYRMASPVFLKKDAEEIDAKHWRPLRLDSVGLTNRANLKGVMKPLTNDRKSDDLAGKQKESMNPLVLTLLGLPATADESAVLSKVQAIVNESQEKDKKILTLSGEITTLKNEQSEKEIATIADKYSNRYAANLKPSVISLLKNDRESAIAFLEALPEPKANAQSGVTHNRQNVKEPSASSGAENVAAKRNQKIVAIKNNCKCGHAEAVRLAREECPELFTVEATNSFV